MPDVVGAFDSPEKKMTRTALMAIQNRRPLVKTRIFKALSDQALAISWWSPSSLPAWLNEEYYVQKIRQRLKTIKVREIAQALHVSEPDAAFIRSSRRRPHPRHWDNLAQLVGVSNP
jgi:hypothetical protein